MFILFSILLHILSVFSIEFCLHVFNDFDLGGTKKCKKALWDMTITVPADIK